MVTGASRMRWHQCPVSGVTLFDGIRSAHGTGDEEGQMSWLARLEAGMAVEAADGTLGSIASVPRIDFDDPVAPAEVIVLASQENAGPGVEEFRRVTRDMIDRVEERAIYLNVNRSEVPTASAAVADAHRRLRQSSDHLRIPLVEEEIETNIHVRELGHVEIHKKIDEYLFEGDVPLRFHEVDIERIPIDEVVPDYIEPYMDGDTYVIPVIEEEVVTSTRLRLREEFRVRRTTAEHTEAVRAPYRRERLVINEYRYDDGSSGVEEER
jgi:uncharacterized protein (TIGR02271 family)